ncbi:hypothetical protein CLV24_12035 [Pontibacter ummariensis]|uniref:Uncharacterized protein n=1 Tax=Pontibacter ummariensis TaxID=1610492 RepID=A0A239J430_9BACT|nr:hypothetical protein [Pontibacter ummariensis]PRY08871.1 hypothetical protein CLV24_12035 [Pontibacter ummariensis]SNT00565.1 hypothetical protein SAMN06296052_12034 [Pontibacter ummariensis]
MPVSRNRKKKNNSSRVKAAPPMCIHELFKLQTNPCRKCGRVRDEFSYKELPDKEQPHWKETGVLDSIDYFLYCPSCEEYSALFMTEEF